MPVTAILLLTISFKTDRGETAFVRDNFLYADAQLKNMLGATGDAVTAFPRTINEKGKLVTTDMYDWTSGFFPGSLWYAYEYTRDSNLKKAAIQWT